MIACCVVQTLRVRCVNVPWRRMLRERGAVLGKLLGAVAAACPVLTSLRLGEGPGNDYDDYHKLPAFVCVGEFNTRAEFARLRVANMIEQNVHNNYNNI